MRFVSRGPSEFCFRICYRNALTEKAWEDAVEGLSKARHTTDLTGSKYQSSVSIRWDKICPNIF